ncbi:MAG: dihydroorotate dehydrogenase [Desulfobacterales bacterium]|uniref:Dihydroorotate dehydrogenase n=1 Tax=Candidatus Desulfaltia bathyphila TaxID=2841697 RepID=A0A8J6T6U1_9BACT|nr:dihydroorotate dehydrogenase [Candidatus Desulfaltia bathyphila]MBL7195720.1 dihydroorotate dehydrogenase [Desulfobacterales bacterium]MBL7207017.1 dihydroorotate dehydrogenase [Desulfobacterales bacterium]
MENKADLKVNIGGIELKNPVMTASGTFGYASEFENLIDLNRLGAIIVKGLSLKPSMGNPPPRIVETPRGMLNAIGLENVGFTSFVEEKLPFLKELSTPIIINIYGKDIQEYAELASRINDIKEIAGIEVNISCPNVKAGGAAFGTDPEAACKVVKAVRDNTGKPLMVKLTPNVTDITLIARSVEDAGADSISLINTITGIAIDIETRRPKLANITGGLSGPAIKPIALRMVWQVVQKVKIPVIGVGGIMTAEDALEFLIAGAAAVQVGTANLINPHATIDIIEGIEAFLIKRNIPRIQDIIGTLQTNSYHEEHEGTRRLMN